MSKPRVQISAASSNGTASTASNRRSPSLSPLELQRESRKPKEGRCSSPQLPYAHTCSRIATARSGDFSDEVKASAALTICTDGLIVPTRHGGGAAVYKNGNVWSGRVIAQGKMTRSCDAEMSAMFSAFAVARAALQPHQRRLIFVTDSQNVLEWMSNGCMDAYMAPIVQGTQQAQQDFARNGMMVIFNWVKGDLGNEGNGVADQLAALASRESSRGLVLHYDIADAETHVMSGRTNSSTKPNRLKGLKSRQQQKLRTDDRTALDKHETAALVAAEVEERTRRAEMANGDVGPKGCVLQ